MAKYLLMWELDLSRASTDLNIESKKVVMEVDMLKKDMKDGQISDFGCFAGGIAGYMLMEGNATDVFKVTYRYSPFITCKAYPVISADELRDAVKSVMGK